jgi:endonuclease YncB( thermonuclease family)
MARVVVGDFVLSPLGHGTEPDGDTVRFRPDHRDGVCGARRCPEFKAGGTVNVRFASVDAPELHYRCGDQARDIAVAARDSMLAGIGFREVRFIAPKHGIPTRVASALPQASRGYLLVTGLDTASHRVVAYVFAGPPPNTDGAIVPLSAESVRTSVNVQLVRDGLAYPLFYEDTVTPEILKIFDQALATARTSQRPLWTRDTSRNWNVVRGVRDLSGLAVWPKLVRRLCDYLNSGHAGVGGFPAWLRQAPHRNDVLWIRSTRRYARLTDVVAVRGEAVTLRFAPEDLVTATAHRRGRSRRWAGK